MKYFIFPRKRGLAFHANYLLILRRQHCIKRQTLFSEEKNKKNIISLWSAESAQTVERVKLSFLHCFFFSKDKVPFKLVFEDNLL